MEEVHRSSRVIGKLPWMAKVGRGVMEMGDENGGGEEECGVYVNVRRV